MSCTIDKTRIELDIDSLLSELRGGSAYRLESYCFLDLPNNRPMHLVGLSSNYNLMRAHCRNAAVCALRVLNNDHYVGHTEEN